MTDAPRPDGIDPDRLRICLEVLAEVHALPLDHPDAVRVRRATSSLVKTIKVLHRKARREADARVTASTATAAPGRIDDETRGIALTEPEPGTTSVGRLHRPRSCYVCKQRYHEIHPFYHQLCPPCADLNWAKREARTDLSGRRALLTGGRAKIGMYIALRLLRDGAHTTITTRFPNDAVRRFAAMPDSAEWLHRLRIVGVDLRDPRQVVALADTVADQGPLDVLINNAAQTVRRTPGAYSQLVAAEAAPLPAGTLPEVVTLGSPAHEHPLELGTHAFDADELTALSLTSRSASLDRVAASTAIDAGGLVPDLAAANSWTDRVHEVDALELLEVQLCNVTAPFILVSRLRRSLAAAQADRTYVVNVSAIEGRFNRGYKGAGHPHTNMAKAALNMLTRTSSEDLYTDGILMTSVDTGWITDERPHPTKARLAEEGFHAPLDLVDGAARVYDPIVRGERGEDLFGCFLKDYQPSAW
ncbi:MAG TPA: SDR family NAD(P)-dependent oxidoreductase [Mycobacteriales bacterium]|nr:SDR family NAD(P)-dependent oxidoreductase [Mycobacteriales bacterium]